MSHLSYHEILKKYPSNENDALRSDISEILRNQKIKLIILDDDPTGIQTVHDCLLLSNWKSENLATAFCDNTPFFYILANTRSMTSVDSERITREIMNAVLETNKSFGFRLIFISRSDSTLRGHFPIEPQTMREVLVEYGQPLVLPTFFIPSFLEAGRFTINQIHYMKDGDDLIPVAETEFAADNVFGYKNSNLSDYISEKTNGEIDKENIGWISLETLRNNNAEELVLKIKELIKKNYVIVDALDYCDLEIFSKAFLTLYSRLDTYAVLRTSSSLPKAMSGIFDIDLLNKNNLSLKKGPGLIVVGSHVKKSTIQLQLLLENKNVEGVEIDINQVLEQPDKLLSYILETLNCIIEKGLTPVLYTSRQELRLEDSAKRLEIGQKISAFLVKIVRELPFTPTFIIAKGGITSHDILTKGLDIEIAVVKGQIIPGVPVLCTDSKHKFPDMSYIIFPGNVGDENGLVTVLEKLT